MNLAGFVGGSYVAQSPIVGGEECWNLFTEVEQVPGQDQPRVGMYRDPGLRVFTTAGAGPVRGLFSQDGRTYAASGTGVYQLTADRSAHENEPPFVGGGPVVTDGTATPRGTIAAGNGPVMFATNGTGGNQLLVLASGYLYVLNLVTNVFALVADADLATYQGRIASIGFIDGYGLVHIRDTAQFLISALEDFTSWDPTDIFQKSRTSDNVKVLVTILGQAWLFGSRTIEPWYDSGDASTPFQPVPDVMVMQGILSTDSWTFIDSTVFWAGENEDGGRVAYRGTGFTPQRISTHAVETAWRSYSQVSDVTVWDYLHQGHAFVQFDFPSQDVSWVYDTKANLWHKRGYWDLAAGQYRAHLGRCHVYAFEKHLVGSRVDGTIYEQTAAVYDDAGTPQRWMRRAPAARRELLNAVHARFYVDCEVGTTPLSSGQGSKPRIMLRYSDTSTKTWSVERWRDLGQMGRYATRVIWNKLGLARGPQGRIYEVSGTDPIPIAFRGAGVDLGRG